MDNREKIEEYHRRMEIRQKRWDPVYEVTTETYKSGLDYQDQLLVEAFLFLLKKEKIIYNDVFKNTKSSFLEILNNLIYASESINIVEFFHDYIEPICKRGRKLYWNSIVQKYANLKIEVYSKEEIPLFFDDNILRHYISNIYNNDDAIQPNELTELFDYFLKPDQNLDYYNPFAGLGSLAINLPNRINYYGEEIEQFICLLAQIRMLIYESPSHFSLVNRNCFKSWSTTMDIKYDHISFNPPFNLKIDESYIDLLNAHQFGDFKNANSLIISECFMKLKDEGRMVFLIPNGFLYSNNSKERELKKYLVENKFVQTVIAFPEHVLQFTSIAVNLVVLSKETKRNSEITFIDASNLLKDEKSRGNVIDVNAVIDLLNSNSDSEFKKSISIQEIGSNNYSLLVNRYVYEKPILKEEENKQLLKLIDLIKSIPKIREKVTTGKFVRIRNLSDDSINFKKTFDDLEEIDLKSTNSYRLNPNVLLLAKVWNALKPTFFIGNNEPVYYSYPEILAVEINHELIDIEYLILELQKEYVTSQIKQKKTSGVVPRITSRELLEIQIVVPSLQKQNEKKYIYKEALLKQQQEAVKELAYRYGIDVADENSFLRHQIAGTLKNARMAFKSLSHIIEEKVEPNFPNLYLLKFNDKLKTNFLNYLQMLDRDLTSIHKSVNMTGDTIELLDLKVERFNFIKFIDNYVQEVENRTSNIFEISLKIDENALRESKVKEIFINGDKGLLRKMFDNIIENSERHAFNNEISIRNKIYLELLYDFEDLQVQLDIGNTGKPLPEDYSWEAFTRKGSKAGINAGDGFGGWFINEVMKKHGGLFGFTDETGPEGIEGDVTTTIELTFPIEIKI